MKTYIFRKIIGLPLILIGVSLLIFLALRALPGDPARLMAGAEATHEAVDAMRTRLGLDRSLVEQYVSFAVNAVQGDFGTSIRSKCL